jgi:hypothetical protein
VLSVGVESKVRALIESCSMQALELAMRLRISLTCRLQKEFLFRIKSTKKLLVGVLLVRQALTRTRWDSFRVRPELLVAHFDDHQRTRLLFGPCFAIRDFLTLQPTLS